MGPGLDFILLVEEPLEAFLPKDHPLAAQTRIGVQELAAQTFLSVSGNALSASGKPPALRRVIDRYLKECDVAIRPSHEVDNLGSMDVTHRVDAGSRASAHLREKISTQNCDKSPSCWRHTDN